jgi:hypothetical protein
LKSTGILGDAFTPTASPTSASLAPTESIIGPVLASLPTHTPSSHLLSAHRLTQTWPFLSAAFTGRSRPPSWLRPPPDLAPPTRSPTDLPSVALPRGSSPLSLPSVHQLGVAAPTSGNARSGLADRNVAGSAFGHNLSYLPNSRWSPVVPSLATAGPIASRAPVYGATCLHNPPPVSRHDPPTLPTSSSKLLSPFVEPFESAGRTKERWATSSTGFTSSSSASLGSSA